MDILAMILNGKQTYKGGECINMNVLSLFDGCSCGQQALKEQGISIENYYASEINNDAINITQDNHPNTIQLGDVENLLKLDECGNIVVVGDGLKELPKIDMLIGGSPCQGISRAKSGKLDLKDIRSRLFFNYVAIRDWIINNNNPDLIWLLENVVPNQPTLEIMNNATGVNPIYINSSLFVAQDRPRLYWTNIEVEESSLPCESELTISSIMQRTHGEKVKNLVKEGYQDTIKWGKNYMQWDTSGKGHYSQQNRARYTSAKMNTLTKSNGGDKTRIYLGKDEYGVYYRNASVEELEILQGLPVGYTDVVKSKGKRRGIIGDGWTVPVIRWVFNFIK